MRIIVYVFPIYVVLMGLGSWLIMLIAASLGEN